jgi:hypothetical protein
VASTLEIRERDVDRVFKPGAFLQREQTAYDTREIREGGAGLRKTPASEEAGYSSGLGPRGKADIR